MGATEHFVFKNEDGSIHVAEFDIDGAIFHLHQTMRWMNALEPITANGVTAVIGLFVEEVQAFVQTAIAPGATLIQPTTDHDYGYRPGMFQDPFRHYWQVQKRI